MKRCDLCDEGRAMMRVDRVVGRKTKTLNLCSACAGKLGGESFHTEITGLFKRLLTAISSGHLASKVGEVAGKDESVVCEECGTSWETFVQTGRLGCSRCYDVFLEEIERLLVKLEIGRKEIDTTSTTGHDDGSLLEDLRRRLARAVEEEAYERAAELRDRIRECER